MAAPPSIQLRKTKTAKATLLIVVRLQIPAPASRGMPVPWARLDRVDKPTQACLVLAEAN
jgi:hypothetical protein